MSITGSEERILFPEWRDQNRDTKYPFSDSAKMSNREGIVIPNNLFIDAVIHPLGGKERAFLSRVELDYDQAIIYIGDVGKRERCYGTVNFSGTLSDYVELFDFFGRPAGLLVSEGNNLLNLASWGNGIHEFDIEDTEFCATVCCPVSSYGISGFVLEDGSFISGDVWFVGENGVILGYAPIDRVDLTNQSTSSADGIVINVVGDPLFKRKFCDEVFVTPRFIKKIIVIGPNGQFTLTPDSRGNIDIYISRRLADDTVLRINGVENGIILGVASSNGS